MYQIAGKTGTAQVKSIAQGKRYNEASLTSRQLDHGLFVGFAPAENPEIAIAVVWENGKHGGSAAQLARPVFDYWLLKRKKDPLLPQNHEVSGGLMTAGIKPGELASGDPSLTANPNAVAKPKPGSTAQTTQQTQTSPPVAPTATQPTTTGNQAEISE